MDAYTAAFQCSDFILSQDVLSIEQIVAKYTPYAQGVRNNWIHPSPLCLHSPRGKQYANFLQQQVDCLDEWVEIMRQLRDVYQVSLTRMSVTVFKLYITHMLKKQCNQLLVPYCTVRASHNNSSLDCKMINWTEFVIISGTQDMATFFHHIIHCILFGFPLTDYYCSEVLAIPDAGAYLASRLFQGSGDVLLMKLSGHVNPVSLFVTPDLAYAYNTDLDHEAEMLGTYITSGATKRMKRDIESQVQNIRTIAMKGHFLGTNSEMILTLTRNGAFSFPNRNYESYLARGSPLLKVSYEIWQDMVHGRYLSQVKDATQFAGEVGADPFMNYSGTEVNLAGGNLLA